VTTRRIRFAQPDEASTLSRVALRSKAHWGYDNSFLESCRAELDVPPSACDGTHLIVAIEDATLARFARISGGQPEGELSALFVDPPFMKQGVGGDLLRAVMVQASARLVCAACSSTPIPALKVSTCARVPFGWGIHPAGQSPGGCSLVYGSTFTMSERGPRGDPPVAREETHWFTFPYPGTIRWRKLHDSHPEDWGVC
jgi:GNAT superfamily N-acetyltransferase